LSPHKCLIFKFLNNLFKTFSFLEFDSFVMLNFRQPEIEWREKRVKHRFAYYQSIMLRSEVELVIENHELSLDVCMWMMISWNIKLLNSNFKFIDLKKNWKEAASREEQMKEKSVINRQNGVIKATQSNNDKHSSIWCAFNTRSS
jgi:hypothetical protein